MTRPRSKQTGFATFSAIALMGLVAIALAAASAVTAKRLHRYTERSDQAQIDQLLAAGTIRAQSIGNNLAEDQPHLIQLPEALESPGTSLILRRKGETVFIDAKFQGKSLTRVITVDNQR